MEDGALEYTIHGWYSALPFQLQTETSLVSLVNVRWYKLTRTSFIQEIDFSICWPLRTVTSKRKREKVSYDVSSFKRSVSRRSKNKKCRVQKKLPVEAPVRNTCSGAAETRQAEAPLLFPLKKQLDKQLRQQISLSNNQLSLSDTTATGINLNSNP